VAYDTSYEPASGWIMGQVLAHSRWLLRGGTAFGTATSPSLGDVETLIDARSAQVGVLLAQHGYAVTQPLATAGTPVLRVLGRAVAVGALIDIFAARAANATQSNEEHPRYVMFMSEWKRFREEIAPSAALEYMGAIRTRAASAGLEVTGIDQDRIDDFETDTSYRGPRFRDPDMGLTGTLLDADRDSGEPAA
jgi:hypothetical protein